MTSLRNTAFLIVLSTAVLVATGCGGDSGKSTAGGGDANQSTSSGGGDAAKGTSGDRGRPSTSAGAADQGTSAATGGKGVSANGSGDRPSTSSGVVGSAAIDIPPVQRYALGRALPLPTRIRSIGTDGVIEVTVELDDAVEPPAMLFVFAAAFVGSHLMGIVAREFEVPGTLPGDARLVRVEVTDMTPSGRMLAQVAPSAAAKVKVGERLLLVRPWDSFSSELESLPDVVPLADRTDGSELFSYYLDDDARVLVVVEREGANVSAYVTFPEDPPADDEPLAGPELNPVEGTLTIDGQPPKGVLVHLYPIDPIENPIASGRCEADGTFTLLSGAEGRKGAAAGKYKVVLAQVNQTAEEYAKELTGRTSRGFASPPPPEGAKRTFHSKYLQAATSDKEFVIEAKSNTIRLDVDAAEE